MSNNNSDADNTAPQKSINASDHLANERTFLAWIRTSIGIMAFGFVVVKFSIFIKQISLVLGRQLIVHEHGYSSAIGILLVGAGAGSALLAYLRYRHVKQQLDSNTFDSSSSLIVTVTALILLIGIALVTYLIQST